MLRRAFQRHRWRLISVAAIAVVALIAVVAVAMATQWGIQRSAAEKPPAKEPPPSLGIDLIHCPEAEPEDLPPYALADATEAALDQVPSVFGHVIAYVGRETQTSEGAYAFSAYLTRDGGASRPGMIRNMCHERPQQAKLLLDRSVEVNMEFPEVAESPSLSQHTVYVAKFEGHYWVYGIGH
jgi:hypothetical protein